jgi:hypothetical protein
MMLEVLHILLPTYLYYYVWILANIPNVLANLCHLVDLG